MVDSMFQITKMPSRKKIISLIIFISYSTIVSILMAVKINSNDNISYKLTKEIFILQVAMASKYIPVTISFCSIYHHSHHAIQAMIHLHHHYFSL